MIDSLEHGRFIGDSSSNRLTNFRGYERVDVQGLQRNGEEFEEGDDALCDPGQQGSIVISALILGVSVRESSVHYCDYARHLKESKAIVVLRLVLLQSTQLIATHIQRVLNQRHADGVNLDYKQLLTGVYRHARFTRRGKVRGDKVVEGTTKATRMRLSSGSILHGVEAACKLLEDYPCNNPHAEDLEQSQDGTISFVQLQRCRSPF